MKNNRTLCIDEYHDFKAKDRELLKDTYARFNTLISKCRRSGVIRTMEDNNMLFLKSLGNEWLHLTMSMSATLDLETTSLADLHGTLAAQESGKEKEERKEERKKEKKALRTQSDEDSDEEKTTTKDLMETIALLTRELKRGYRGRSSGRDSYNRRGYDRGYNRGQDKGYDRRMSPDRRVKAEKEEKVLQKNEEIRGEDKKEGCFRCGKLGHFAAECWSTGLKVPQKPFPKVVKDEAYFKWKAYYYT
ncbi:hypothetical protein OSB04_023839 [Centaurea solstitialis]|uniref:CCHC-type domain-containing protein n=1 Tax=Centaurea solstitialis TaxID=347529 RepID=A0AA38W020_9ASTR|nr:hypothetical protein OSB04_023839 [Centaurea solstitialis]